MQHFPIFLDLAQKRVIVAGNGEFALAKLRLLARTPARLEVFAPAPSEALAEWLADHRLTATPRAPEAADLAGAALVYAAHGEAAEDGRLRTMAAKAGVLINVVDDLQSSDFITPAIVDRAPVTVAIGTEGAAPVLARAIKADLEERLPEGLGPLARAGKLFRAEAEALPQGPRRRAFWADYYFDIGPQVLAEVGEELLGHALRDLLARHLAATPAEGRVDLVGTGPGAADLLTLRARQLLDRADVVIHDHAIGQPILDLARREALFLAVDGEADLSPAQIGALMATHAGEGARVVRLIHGEAARSPRLGAEIAPLVAAGLAFALTPGVAPNPEPRLAILAQPIGKVA